MRGLRLLVCAGLVSLSACFSARGHQPDASPASGTNGSAVPRLIQFSGVVKDATGKPAHGQVTLTFSLYADQEGSAPLWAEMQAVEADEQGHYTALLGATQPEGLPLDLFTTGEARWLGVQPELTGVGEQPRVLLVGVPYALKAADADTLGGKPASAYTLSNPESQSGNASARETATAGGAAASAGGSASGKSGNANSTTGPKTASGTQNYVAKFVDTSNDLGNSQVFDNGVNVGVGTASPGFKLSVNKGATVGDGLALYGTNDTRVHIGIGQPTSWSWANGWATPGDFSLIEEGISGSRIYVKPGGNVGIGTASPSTMLEVNKGTTIGGGIYVDGSNDTRLRLGLGQPTVWSWANGWATPGDFSLIEEGVSGSRIYVKPGGNVGIGTSAPAATLDVNGMANFRQPVTFASGQTFPGTATLGSNNFVGNETITGTLTVASNGTISLATNGGGLAIQPNGSGPNMVGGYGGNSAGFGVFGATIAGGGEANAPNSVTGNYATVAGGSGNTAGTEGVIGGGRSNMTGGDLATVCGGAGNVAGWSEATVGGGGENQATAVDSTVGGGSQNSATDTYATVGGGSANIASASAATVAGGNNSTASGINATVPGGWANLAQGASSLAAGQFAQARHDGTFVWGDASTTNNVSSTGKKQFVARASGGVTFYTSSDLHTGAKLASGSGSWSSLSDRNAKANLMPVSGSALLSELAAVPISTWNYKAQPASIRHMGPMAQEFYAAFGLGEDDKHISTVDSEGVALAAIQELYRLVQSQQEEIRRLKVQVRKLEQR